MEPLIIIAIATTFGASIYMMLSKSIIRLVIGIAMLSNAVNLIIFVAGRVPFTKNPPIIPQDQTGENLINIIANPLPQALILTAIVISFSLLAFILVLAYRAYEELNTDNSDEMRLAEPVIEKQKQKKFLI